MFKTARTRSKQLETLIGSSTAIEGNIQSEGTIRVEGTVSGDIKTCSNVFIGPAAQVKGNIEANDVHVAGTVEGNVQSRGILRVLSTARLYGDIQVRSFVADEGGIFHGKCSMVELAEIESAGKKSNSGKSRAGSEYKKGAVLSQISEEK